MASVVELRRGRLTVCLIIEDSRYFVRTSSIRRHEPEHVLPTTVR